jgi:hypothetical protein
MLMDCLFMREFHSNQRRVGRFSLLCAVEVIVKLSPIGKLVIITVYVP